MPEKKRKSARLELQGAKKPRFYAEEESDDQIDDEINEEVDDEAEKPDIYVSTS